MSSFPPVQSVVRAIELLKALNRQPVSSLDILHRHTGLPKPSIVRLLQTLSSIGLVKAGPQHGTYYLTAEVRTLSAGFHTEPKAIECGAPVLEAFTAKHKWPVSLAVFDDNAVVVRYSTVPNSPLSLLHNTIGLRHSLVSRALGRAFLAFCDPQERDAIIEVLQTSAAPEDAPARERASLVALLDDIRAKGYAVRDPSVRPVSNTIAVPIFERGRAIGSIGLTYFSSTLKVEEALRRYLADLQQAGRAISDKLSEPVAEAAPLPEPPTPKARRKVSRREN